MPRGLSGFGNSLSKAKRGKTMKRLSNKDLVEKLMKNPRLRAEYDALGSEFELLETMLKARSIAGLSQSQVARKMRTTTSVVGRLEASGSKTQHSPSVRTLERYAKALGCRLKIDFIRTAKSA